MTLTAEQSSNKAKYEAAPTAEIIGIIRTAMGEGCIRPCHVYDAVDELIFRIQALENRPKRNCDVGTPEEQLKRFKDFCRIISKDETCDGCPLLPQCSTLEHCTLKWAQMPYAQEGGAK